MSLERLLGERAYTPDVLDCLANLSADEVFTPPKIVNAMLDLLPEEVWQDPELRWLDPACKSGAFLREAARRLMEGLKGAIPDELERREHIFKRMLYGVAITELTGQISRRSLYYSKTATHKRAVVGFEESAGNIVQRRSEHLFERNRCSICGAPASLETSEREGLENYAYTFIHEDDLFDMKFDVIIGNPPYQLESGGYGAQATPIYHLFVEQAMRLNPRYLSFIMPARWYAGGMGLDHFRESMINDRSLKVLVDYPKLFEAFPGVEIKGGVCYFLRDRDYDGDCEVRTVVEGEIVSIARRDLRAGGGVLIRSNEGVAILEKVRAKKEPTIEKVVSPLNPFNLPTNYSNHSPRRRDKNSVLLYLRGGTAWIPRGAVSKNSQWIDKHKVLTPKAGDGHGRVPMKVTGVPIVAAPGSACTMTYIVAGVFDTAKEAENYAAYLRTKFVRHLVSLRKPAQNVTAGVFAFVPALGVKRRWTDSQLYERYGLTREEVAHIESVIKEMAE